MSTLFDFDREPDEYAVMGNPITHSKSPMIHSLFAEQTSQRLNYSAIQVDPGGFDQAVGNFFANGGKGLNITVPFKQEAWSLASSLSERAKLAGAVNTLKPSQDGQIFGENTDGVGLVNDISSNLGVDISGKSVLLIGAGGAARGVLAPLLDNKPDRLVICNRSSDRAIELAQQFKQYGLVIGTGFESLAKDDCFEIVINATSASLAGEIPPLPEAMISNSQLCYDMMYDAKPTVFMDWCSNLGSASVRDGLGMLVEQAAESFLIWRGIKPDTAPVIAQVRQTITQ